MIAAIRFLSSLAKGVHHGVFQDEKALTLVCEQIVIPHIHLRGTVSPCGINNLISSRKGVGRV